LKIESYKSFIDELDKELAVYFEKQADYICCKKGCSACCEKGDYPLTEIELYYLMQGYSKLDNDIKTVVQENCKNMIKGEVCPFLINKECSVYAYRPIICRVHGLAYEIKNNKVKLPYCAGEGKNFSKAYENGEVLVEPIHKNLDTKKIFEDIDCGEMRNLYGWINKS